jgi:pimeloyl-ACP methyl ester carboxylesterase
MHIHERQFQVNGLSVATVCHGDATDMPVLALHGWLDNAASFSRLAPLLTGCYTVAIDMPGQGMTSHRFPQGSYNLWDDLLDLLALADQLGWQRFHLLAHSRGAMIALLLAAVAPERVCSLNLLDGILPLPVKAEDCVKQLQRFVADFRRPSRQSSKIYASFDDALQARCVAANMTEITARPIVERALELSSLGYRWRHDTRVMAASSFKLTQPHIDAVMQSLKVSTLLLLAEHGVMKVFGETLQWLQQFPLVQQQYLGGSHHFHLEPDIAGRIAEQLLPHITSHHDIANGIGI